MPSGARFYRCALQINPYSYVHRHRKATGFANETAYNQVIIDACKHNGVEVIAITDHHRCDTARALAEAASETGIIVFPGAELETKEGVHFLLLFDPNDSWQRCTGILGECGIHDQGSPPNAIRYDVQELLEQSAKWGCVCIAAHVASEKGLLRVLDGQARVAAWRSKHLLACSLPGPVIDAPDNIRPILENKLTDYRRDRPPAILNAQDVSSLEDLVKVGASCWIKMSEVSVEALRQAFLDPSSRIRLAGDPEPQPHTEFVAMGWEGGFLDGAGIHFNDNLNVLIGGRGTGKSTVIESLRYVIGLEPIGEEARKTHEGIVRQVLRPGTKISLLLRSPHPSSREYLIERTVPNPPQVKDETGSVLNLSPADIISRVEVYGQHEISELTRSREKLTRLLDRFLDPDNGAAKRKRDVRRQLERSRTRVLETHKELTQIAERLAALPALEETLRRFQEAGLEDKLKEQSLLVREEGVLKTIEERMQPFKEILWRLKNATPTDLAFLSPEALENLPGGEILAEGNAVLGQLNQDLLATVLKMEDAIGRAQEGIGRITARWQDRRRKVLTEYETILRELQKSKVDGEEFMRLRRLIEELRPLKERQATLQRDLKEYGQERRNLLSEWEDIKAGELRRLERAAKKVSRRLHGRVSVEVTAAGNREPLFKLMREQVGGRLSEAIDIVRQEKSFSLPAFADACREGRDSISQKFAIPPAQATRIAEAGAGVFMQIEELDLPPSTLIRLNTASEGQPEQWQTLEDLSTGQKATAILLLLLLESDAPLVVDQPEDDLDNRFISDGVVPRMREEKRRRQFIFATHNANIPVLGDADLIAGLSASGEAEQGKARLPKEHMGSIDSSSVREMVEEILEGGKDAFEMRRLKYGF